MNTSAAIYALCKKHTDLTDLDVKKVIEVSKSLEIMAEFYESDVFIDVMSRDNDIAIVVCEAKPSSGKSVYSSSVVGEKALRKNEPGALRTLKTGVPSRDIRAMTQEDRFVRQKVFPITNEKKVVGVIIVEKDISDEIKGEFSIGKLSPLKQKLISHQFMTAINSNQIINNNLGDAILIFDKEGLLRIKNVKADTYYSNIGYMDDIQGLHYDNLSLDNTTFDQVVYGYGENMVEQPEKNEIKVGKYYFVIKKIIMKERDLKLAMIISDITEIKNKEAEIISKSVAIREIHHRVKNNLQTVASLLRIQSRRCVSEEAKINLQESVSRILAIAATHEILSKQISDLISITNVINSILLNIKRCFNNTSKQIEIDLIGEDFYIDSDRATAIALIINELIQNCYDHAFEDMTKGEIQVLIEGDEDYKIIAVIDNGKGFNVEEENIDSLGLSIVKSYVKDKLIGNINIYSDENGTKVIIEFPLFK
ncbi:sensor histidine kinase [uncultured Clostridium sp.]|uniref:sensor histidine kinase n=1 Tax=uncultured Clostridium sp. TaxID=59620 RepID=UPI0028EF64C4|nr:sensor histidine kinase [uncultured Clostridium sp.]